MIDSEAELQGVLYRGFAWLETGCSPHYLCCAWVVCAHKQGWGWCPAGGRVGTGHQSFLIGRAAHKRSGCRRARQGSGRDYRNYPAANQALPRLPRQMEVISPYKNHLTLICPEMCTAVSIWEALPSLDTFYSQAALGNVSIIEISSRWLPGLEAPAFRRLTDRSCGVTYSRRHPMLLAPSTLQIRQSSRW